MRHLNAFSFALLIEMNVVAPDVSILETIELAGQRRSYTSLRAVRHRITIVAGLRCSQFISAHIHRKYFQIVSLHLICMSCSFNADQVNLPGHIPSNVIAVVGFASTDFRRRRMASPPPKPSSLLQPNDPTPLFPLPSRDAFAEARHHGSQREQSHCPGQVCLSPSARSSRDDYRLTKTANATGRSWT